MTDTLTAFMAQRDAELDYVTGLIAEVRQMVLIENSPPACADYVVDQVRTVLEQIGTTCTTVACRPECEAELANLRELFHRANSLLLLQTIAAYVLLWHAVHDPAK